MFYRVRVKDYIRVPPSMFNEGKTNAILANVRATYENFVSKKLGFVVTVLDIHNVEEGVIIPGDGAAYYGTEFDLLLFRPEMNELVYGNVRDITDFGAFLDLGGSEGMSHISQSMDDYVSFSKDKVLQGKNTHHTLKVGDNCRARIIAVSFKDLKNPKIGLSMRQEGLGKLEWLNEEKKKGVAKE